MSVDCDVYCEIHGIDNALHIYPRKETGIKLRLLRTESSSRKFRKLLWNYFEYKKIATHFVYNFHKKLKLISFSIPEIKKKCLIIFLSIFFKYFKIDYVLDSICSYFTDLNLFTLKRITLEYDVSIMQF